MIYVCICILFSFSLSMLGREPRRDGVFRTVERSESGGKFTVDWFTDHCQLVTNLLLRGAPKRSALLG